MPRQNRYNIEIDVTLKQIASSRLERLADPEVGHVHDHLNSFLYFSSV